MRAAVGNPSVGNHGMMTPRNPPITHAICKVVSPRANALAWARTGTPVWMVESRDTLARYCIRPAVSPSATSVMSS